MLVRRGAVDGPIAYMDDNDADPVSRHTATSCTASSGSSALTHPLAACVCLSLLCQRTVGDAVLAASAAQASNQPLTRALRSQLGYSLPATEALPDDLYSRNHTKKAQQAATEPNNHSAGTTTPTNRLGGRTAEYVKHEHARSLDSMATAAQQQLAVHIRLEVGATGRCDCHTGGGPAEAREGVG